MSRANVSEAYYRLKYSDTDSDHLKEEFIRLRNSTRNTLEQSWIERESLQQQCGACDEVIADHNEECIEIRERKEAWKERCLTAEATLQERSEEKDSLRHYRKVSLPERLRLWAGGNDEQDIETKKIVRPRDSLQDHNRPAFIRSASSWPGRNADGQDDKTKLQGISESRESLQDHKRPQFIRSVSSRSGGNDDGQDTKLQEISEPRESLQDHKRPAFTGSTSSLKVGENNRPALIRSLSLPVRSWPGGNDDGQDNETKLQEISEPKEILQDHKIPAFTRSISLMVGRTKFKNEAVVSEFDRKLFSRDNAIVSLEKTLNDTSKSTRDMKAEMQSLVETQRIKEKKLDDSHAQKEKKFKEVIESLNKELCQEAAKFSSRNEREMGLIRE